jgi:hypothetical protein
MLRRFDSFRCVSVPKPMKKIILPFLLLASTVALAQPHPQKPLPKTSQQTIEQVFFSLFEMGLKEDPTGAHS